MRGLPTLAEGVPTLAEGYLPWTGGGYLPWSKVGTPLPWRQTSIVNTCYVSGGMPLAFTQEDFLVTLLAFGVRCKSCRNIC